MPTVIDSLFLELGVDTSKFSKDQAAALAKIAQFEAQTKRAAGNARDGIKTVGAAFRDLADESRIGASAKSVESLASKIKNLGMSMSVSGGAAGGVGMMAMGLGKLLSPASLGIAAMGLLGKQVWDLNADMTKMNATLSRNAELAGMSAEKMWSMGEAAKTVGGSPDAVQAGITSLQTSLAGMAIAVGDATPQLIGMARLRRYGARFNPGGFGNGVDEESLFKAITAYYKQHGRAKTTALVAGYGLGSTDFANLAMSPNGWAEYQKTQAQAKAIKAPGGFEGIVKESLKSQVGIGEKDIAGAVAAEQAYGGIQQPMQTIVGLVTNIYGVLSSILGYISQFADLFLSKKGSADPADDIINANKPKLPNSVSDRKSLSKKLLMKFGLSEDNANAMVGNEMAESSMEPGAFHGSHRGLFQLDKTRVAAFKKRFGYEIGSFTVDSYQQFSDQNRFAVEELQTTHRAALTAMNNAPNLAGKTRAAMELYEVVKDGSFAKRLAEAASMASWAASRGSMDNSISNEVHIKDINVYTPSTDPRAHAHAIHHGLSSHPLINQTAMSTTQLATRGAQ